LAFIIGFLQDLAQSLIALFVILNPIGNIPFYQGVTASATADQRKAVARKAVIVVVIVLFVFAYLGDAILGALQITLNYVMIAGGLFIVVFAVKDAATGSMSNEPTAATRKRSGGLLGADLDRIAVFPIAIPLLAGPGAIATVMVLNHPAYGAAKSLLDFSTGLAIVIDCFIVWLLFILSDRLVRHFKPSIMLIIGKVMDILMGAIGISFLIRGALAIFGLVSV
jgi:multiple antibiotic resistance protein